MKRSLPIAFILLTWFGAALAQAQTPSFSGTWEIDLRNSAERAKKMECGSATFVLKQTKDSITGDHSMATVGCGRVNDGGEGTVKGVVVGSSAVLAVTSGRNGAVVLGVARLQGERLQWVVKEEIKAGTPEGDSALILNKGVLSRSREKPNASK